MNDTDELMTAEEVAKLLGLEKTWVYRAAREGRIPSIELGRYVRFRRQSILNWIIAQERAA